MNELYHHGIKGMKWGIRRYKNKNKNTTQTEKLHLGIDRYGNINLIRGKTTKEAKIAFAIKSSLFVGSMALTSYVSTHPRAIEKGEKIVKNLLKGKASTIVNKPVDSGIYSKSLGRMLTVAEAFEAGFDLSD